MKISKYTFLILLSALVLTACSSDDSPKNSSFEVSQNIVSREPTGEALQRFVESLKTGNLVTVADLYFLRSPAPTPLLGYALCLEAGHDTRLCKKLDGMAHHFEYGICLSAGRTERDCDHMNLATGGQMGFALCMTSGAPHRDCGAVLNKTGSQLGFGFCMASGGDKRECERSLLNDDENIGWGICMAAGKQKRDCEQTFNYAGVSSIGYGLCIALGRSKTDCDQALGAENLAFGICLQAGRELRDCKLILEPISAE